ncbi:MAG: hypothetical protein QM757_32225 [Paludibaculum sp.]
MMTVVQVYAQTPQADSVNIIVMDAYGRLGTSCRVKSFIARTEKALAQLAETNSTDEPDYATSFRGLTGRGIPFGEYIASVMCESPRAAGGSMYALVRQKETVLFLANYSFGGDDTLPGGRPSLAIVLKPPPSGKVRPLWVRAVGVYLERMETAGIDPVNHSS